MRRQKQQQQQQQQQKQEEMLRRQEEKRRREEEERRREEMLRKQVGICLLYVSTGWGFSFRKDRSSGGLGVVTDLLCCLCFALL